MAIDRSFTMRPIGTVRSGRTDVIDDDWDAVPARIELDADRFGIEAVAGLDAFSHIEVVYVFDRVDDDKVVVGARRPRGRADWPLVGIFAQRGKNRPNRIGVTVCRLDRLDGTTLHVSGLDAIEATPVLDIKPYLAGFAPRGSVVEPAWAEEIMVDYW
jgi:tRNA-Thr(GGU) m(6)t(6)A37 methyltransferase TsaA